MLIQLEGSGSYIDTDKVTMHPLKKGSAPAYPVVDSQFGGSLTAGNFKYANANAGESRVVWKTASNAPVQFWKMDSDAAIDALVATIADQFNEVTVPGFIVVDSAGALVP